MLLIVDLTTNDSATPVFELLDGSYTEASRQFIYNDVVISQENISRGYWLKDGLKVYQVPYAVGTKEVKTDLTSYSEVTVTQKVTTHHRTYYKVDDRGWISEDDLSATDSCMEKVQQVLDQKYSKSDYSTYVKQLSTQTTAEVNAGTTTYSAGVAKLTILYYIEEKLQGGTISANDALKYVDTVNSFARAYDPSGGGRTSKITDNKEYTTNDLLEAVAQSSDNMATNILSYYVANQYDDDFNPEISAITETDIDMKVRNMSSKTTANLMEAIYSQDSDIISYLSSTAFSMTCISRDIDVQVAYKMSDAHDCKHDVAIVYADEPFILSTSTNNVSYDNTSNIADDVYAILRQ